MKIKICCAAILGFMLMMYSPCCAVMSSANYAIPASVMSGGGIPMGSDSFLNNATLGQPSPLAMTSSTSYDLYTGFWHTISISVCIWDLDLLDGDVDGADLNQFIHPPYNASDLESFGSEFGRTDCF